MSVSQAVDYICKQPHPGAIDAGLSVQWTAAMPPTMARNQGFFDLIEDSGGRLLGEEAAEHAGIDTDRWVVQYAPIRNRWTYWCTHEEFNVFYGDVLICTFTTADR